MDSTKEKIIIAAETLFSEKGYDGVTTKEIANLAKVSEVTLFRNFENKRNLFEYIIKEKMHPYGVKHYLENDVTYDLETDLNAITDMVFKAYQKNLPQIRMLFKDSHQTKAHKKAKHHHESFRVYLKEYFYEMYQKGKMIDDPDHATTFVILNVFSLLFHSIFVKREEVDKDYFEWMVKKVIDILKPKSELINL